MNTACIIGGGVSGLFCGALLANEGFRVTVLDKNHTAGGGLQTFSRHGVQFNPGMHVFGGFSKNGPLRLLCEHLNIMDKLDLTPCHDTLYTVDTHQRIDIPTGRQQWIDAWCNEYGNDDSTRKQLSDYVDAIDEISLHDSPLAMQRYDKSTIPPISQQTAHDFVAQHITKPTLRRNLCYLTALYGGRPDSPAILHAIINKLHINGLHYFTHGSNQIRDLLTHVIEENGGSVITDAEVLQIHDNQRHISHVSTSHNDYSADIIISTIPINSLLNTTQSKNFPHAFRTRINTTPLTYSAFTLYAVLCPHAFQHSDTSRFYYRQNADPWNLHQYSDTQWPNMAFMMTNPDPNDPTYAQSFSIVVPIDFDLFSKWSDTTVLHRPNDYIQLKQKLAQQVLDMIAIYEGPLPITHLTTASPLTLRDYYGTTNGALYGLHRTVNDPTLAMISTRTRFDNLFLCGQDVNFHGLFGAALSSILTVESILGPNTIIDKINTHRTKN